MLTTCSARGYFVQLPMEPKTEQKGMELKVVEL